ncbi:hypothetical protein N5D36_23785 [Pseudomonas mosselii]|uniref:hypothetical protein n=1 Tax=Pseudomonas mosselii TaxID=78327 RepID=UPI00244AD38C|nr:hypothetical protein [Pseudomonas mosselii]MDH0629546.1 hypothetical protein [Pseudomonas mosselii]MDH0680474.1 hypothetical protein [Pseudomonas mosselii]MDH0927060.1 hypothetical protein [Pseudomonas mosselii]MDH1136313.1 hypothetical protein [Pseudomonas mosselii]MDH1141154.1 hypothetical protein [Pseudomonas mosselii]
MRSIEKRQSPEFLQSFIDGQLAIEPEPVNVTYRNFREKTRLLSELTLEQYGLCGYTGAPVDSGRISELASASGDVVFKNHIEHLKCQDICKQELIDSGKVVGRDLGDDLSYLNMIAALGMSGSEAEHFGAEIKKNNPLPVLPTQADCAAHFGFQELDGGVNGSTAAGEESIKVLKLDHKTLDGWRRSAIEAWLNPEVIQTREDFEEVIQAVENPVDGRLPEFSFVISAIARGYL